jgi:hypothetical protein
MDAICYLATEMHRILPLKHVYHFGCSPEQTEGSQPNTGSVGRPNATQSRRNYATLLEE